MKAKHFKKLRKNRVIQVYTVRETASLFGRFERIGEVYIDWKISASSPIRALIIFLRRYRKRYKQDHEQSGQYFRTTVEKWGEFRVTDEKGFKTYYE